MTDQAKVDFYLRHRTQIEEWTALRTAAAHALDDALIAAIVGMTDAGVPAPEFQQGARRIAKLDITGRPSAPAWIELKWSRSQLLTDTGGLTWPELGVCVSPDEALRDVRARVRTSTEKLARAHGLTRGVDERNWWLWRKRLAPGRDPLVIDDYVSDCIGEFAGLWTAMHEEIRREIEEPAHA